MHNFYCIIGSLCMCNFGYANTLPVKKKWLPSNIFIPHPKCVIFDETNQAPHSFFLSY